MNTEICVWLSADDRAQLESWMADRNTPQKLVWRSGIVLLSADYCDAILLITSCFCQAPTLLDDFLTMFLRFRQFLLTKLKYDVGASPVCQSTSPLPESPQILAPPVFPE